MLTRELLETGDLARLVAESSPLLRILTDEERAASLAETLAARPPGPLWLFAYGSLIWNPAIHTEERRLARIHGWHRCFCLSTIAGRGTPELPGLVLGLDRGGACTGAAFRIAEPLIQSELTLLWRREMLAGSYRPTWVPVRDPAGARFGHAIAFTIRRDGEYYTNLGPETLVHRLATATGALGSSADYLFQTVAGLQALGLHDRPLERLAEAVRALADREGEPPARDN